MCEFANSYDETAANTHGVSCQSWLSFHPHDSKLTLEAKKDCESVVVLLLCFHKLSQQGRNGSAEPRAFSLHKAEKNGCLPLGLLANSLSQAWN